MPPANIETDPFFMLLTDALRAGPGSTQWQEAVDKLRSQGLEGADEHRMLLETRQNIESGKEYRSVRAGPGFTRKVMAEIESESTGSRKRSGIPTATLIAIFCGIVILGAVGFVVWKMSSAAPTGQAVIDELETRSQGFVDKVASANFAGAIPDGWHAIGSLKLDEADGLAPDPKAAPENKNLGGGVVLDKSFPSSQEFAVDVAIHFPESTGGYLLEAFVTTDSNFSTEKGISSKDLVWQLHGRNEEVLVNGSDRLVGNTPPKFHPGDSIRLVVGKDVAIIEAVPSASGKPQRIWAGPHELGAGPKYVGVRFLQVAAPGKSNLSVQQIKVTTSPR